MCLFRDRESRKRWSGHVEELLRRARLGFDDMVRVVGSAWALAAGSHLRSRVARNRTQKTLARAAALASGQGVVEPIDDRRSNASGEGGLTLASHVVESGELEHG